MPTPMTAVSVLSALAIGAPSVATKVDVSKTKEGFALRVDGRPFQIRGVGGDGSKSLLKSSGGNTFRTWGIGEDTPAQLDEAQRLGLKVVLGIWLGHERHGFDYSDKAQVSRQRLQARAAVKRFKDHPALLAWGVGNEMEGFGDGGNPKIWAAVDEIAKMIQEVDPRHPTISVIAGIGGSRVKAVHGLAHVDIVGINTYGGGPTLPERYRAAGGTKPYVVTEFGPPGTWEQGTNHWGVPIEKTSTEKARIYGEVYDRLAADPLCLGSFAFIWGNKQEATATWFGTFLRDGSKLGAVDVLSERWNGKRPANLSPRIQSIALTSKAEGKPGETVTVALEVDDPEGDRLSTEWVLSAEMPKFDTAGENQPAPPTFPKAIVKRALDSVTVRMPTRHGRYRLFAFVRDGKGGAAVANVPLRVKGETQKHLGAASNLPLVVYGEQMNGVPFAPSGYMGDTHAIAMDFEAKVDPKVGETCVQVDFRSGRGWGGVVWQNPPNDWGDKPGGYALTGAKRLTFWARGAKGGERVKFGFGLLKEDKKHFDSAHGEREVELGTAWKRYTFDLEGKNLDRIKTGFYWVVGGQGAPLRFFLDEIRFEG